jgi:hypothetical protein
VGCAMVRFGVGIGWAVVKVCACDFDILTECFGPVEACDEMWRAIECVVVEMW